MGRVGNPSGAGSAVSKALAAEATKSTPTSNRFVLDRKDIPSDRNAYVYRDAKRGGRWCLYFYDKETTKRHRFVLKDGNGKHPPQSIKGQDEAWVLGISRFVELKGKSERGEAIALLTFGEMTQRFLLKEHRRINIIPHEGITKTRYRLIGSQIRWLREFLNNDEKPVHQIKRNTFLTYDMWRKERAKELGKTLPQATTINQELSTLRRCFQEVAVANGFLTRDTIPEIPNIKLSKDKKHRRDDLTDKEWESIERTARLYWIKGKTRKDGDGNIEKNSSGQYVVYENITHAGSQRARLQLIHRELIYWAMRISMDTGIRIGSLQKLRWRDMSENTAIPKEERKIWVSIDVPAEATKTGRSYRISAPIATHLQKLRKVSKFLKPDDFLFTNQKLGEPFSDRIWKDNLRQMLVEAGLAEWAEDDSNNLRKINIHSGKNITWYSFRHTYITMNLRRGVPVAIVAANTDTSLKYIQEHYFHYRADESTQILGKGRKLKGGGEDMSWLDT
jgi:integrase